MKIFLLNGPPRCGKDTIAQMIYKTAPSAVRMEKFAHPLKLGARVLHNISQQVWEDELDTSAKKDTPTELLFGKTPREVQIALSEDFLKPLHGPQVFGRMLASRLQSLNRAWYGSVVVSDSGFRAEAEAVVDAFGADNVFLWNIHRGGCTYDGDSRSYIRLEDLGVRTFRVDNPTDLGAAPDEGEGLHNLRRKVIGLHQVLTLSPEYIEADGVKRLETKEEHQARIERILKNEGYTD